MGRADLGRYTGLVDALTVRRAKMRDLPRLLEIQGSCPEAAQWSRPQYQQALGDPLLGCLVAERRGQIAGLLVLCGPVCGELEILNLAVDPAHRRASVGSTLVGEVLSIPAAYVFLEVRESNAAAIAFYRRLGFATAGRRRNYYQSPAEDALVMRRAGLESAV